MRHRPALAALIAAGLGLGAPLALAQTPAPAPGPAPALSPQQAADQKVVWEALHSGGFQALQSYLPQLKAVLDRAPARYPRVEDRGAVTLLREDGDLPSAAVLGTLLAAAGQGKSTRIEHEFNTYGMAAFLLASFANEMHRSQEAVDYADRGLRLQPDNPRLVTEKATALEELHRPAEALAALDGWLAAEPVARTTTDKARVLRGRGYALTELGRLDEAEAAYRDSLKFEPGHKGAENELTYIAGLKAGRPKTGGISTVYEKARDGSYLNPPSPNPPKP